MTNQPTAPRAARPYTWQRRRYALAALALSVVGTGTWLSIVPAGRAEPPDPPVKSATAEQLKPVMAKLLPLHKKLGKPKPGQWLARFKEPGQTFDEYRRCDPVLPRGTRRVLYIQPLGDFSAPQRKIIDLTADYMRLYFNLPVKVNKDLPLKVIPASARRTHPTWGDKQILSTHVLDKTLPPLLAKDAAALIAFTPSDLWPGQGWNFVFGQASLRQRVGVWSIYRNGDPSGGQAEFRLCLLRTIKTATHETGHMFSMLHCTAYACNMCGSNNRAESDGHPSALCPECLAKVCWATGADPVKRFVSLHRFCGAQGLGDQADFFARSIRALGGTVPAKTSSINAPTVNTP